MSTKKWRQGNRDKVRESNKRWRQKNREKVREIARRWRIKNKERANAINRKWRAAHPDRMKEIRDASIAKKPDMYKEIARKAGRRRTQRDVVERKITPEKFIKRERFWGQHTRDKLTGRYVRYLITKMTGIRAQAIPTELMELKRDQIKALRKLPPGERRVEAREMAVVFRYAVREWLSSHVDIAGKVE